MDELSAWLEGSDGRRWPMAASCAMGRAPSNDVVLEDGKVSRRHALIHKQDDSEYWVIDLGSGNGTFLNGRRVTLATRLNNGDVVALGDRRFTFRQVTARAPTQANTLASAQTIVSITSRQCWLLVADIKGSTALAARLPTTEMAILVGKWMAACKEIIETHGGVINKYLGDGFLAYWPHDEERTEPLLEALRQLGDLQRDEEGPRFRLAMHRGLVTMGGGGSLGEDSLSGIDVVLAFRMEKLAGSLNCDFLVSEAVRSKLGSRLDLKDMGVHELAGFENERPRFFAVV